MQKSDRPRTADGRRRVEKRSAVGGLWSNKGKMEKGEKEDGKKKCLKCLKLKVPKVISTRCVLQAL